MIKEQDPMSGLKGLQDAIYNGYQMDEMITGTSEDGVRFCSDVGGKRLTFASIKNNEVQSYIAFSAGFELYEHEICFGIYYAVPLSLRGENLMAKLYTVVIEDMRKRINRNFYVEAIVDKNNEESNYVAQKLLSKIFDEGVDALSGSPVNAYYKFYKA